MKEVYVSDLSHQGRALCEALQGRWFTTYGVCRCPAHEDRTPSLSVRIGQKALLFTCHAGCQRKDVLAALRQVSPVYLHRPRDPRPQAKTLAVQRLPWFLALWERAEPIQATLAETYLHNRGLKIPGRVPLRFLLRCHHRPSDTWHPALLAAYQLPDGQMTALARLYLDPVDHTLARRAPARMLTNPPGAAAIQLGPAGKMLGLAEGLETGLAASQVHQCPVWAAGSSSRLHALAIPDAVEHLILFADNDTAGRRAVAKARQAYRAPGRTIEACYPPLPFNDWNQVLVGQRLAQRDHDCSCRR